MSLSKITTAVGLIISSVTARKARLVLQRRQGELQSLWDKAKLYIMDSIERRGCPRRDTARRDSASQSIGEGGLE